MPKNIKSEDPTAYPAVVAKSFTDMKFKSVEVTPVGGGLRLSATLQRYNSVTGEEDLGGQYTVNMDDLDQELSDNPKLNQAWDDLIDNLAVIYEYQRLTEKINQSDVSDNPLAMIKRRDAVLTSMRG